MRIALFLLLAASGVQGAGLDEFFSNHCLDCHDDLSKKGGLSIEALNPSFAAADAGTWRKILEQTERHAMPPSDKSQPTDAERHEAVRELEENLVKLAQATATPHPAVLRRLNRTEYRQTIQDLLHLNVASFDPTSEFPEDTRVHGFANHGEKLVTSSFLLRQYVDAAEEIVARAVHFGPPPETRRWELLPPFDRTTKGFIYGENDYYQRTLKQKPPHQSLIFRMSGLPQSGYHPVDELRDGVPVSGWYRIRIQAEGKYRYVDLDPKDPAQDLRKQKFPSLWDSTEPIRLGLYTGTLEGIDPDNKEALDTAATGYQPGQRTLAIWDLPDEGKSDLECRIWLDRGQFPRLGFPNGPASANNRLQSFFKANQERLLSAEMKERYAGNQSDWNIFLWFESARIQVSQIELEGPLHETWPPASHRAIFGEAPYQSDRAQEVLNGFAAKAWRRPVQKEETAPLLNLVRQAEKSGLAPEAAIQEGVKAILSSPQFIFREERGEKLDAYEVASRLSYFLWSSMPDQTLLDLAESGEILKPEVLRVQAARLLDDSRANIFVDEFLNGWLGMRKLGTMAPDVHRFAVYYDNDLEAAMRMETRLFFKQMLSANEPIGRFLDSPDSFINKELAQLYGVDPKMVLEAQKNTVKGLSEEELVPDADGHAPSLGFAQVPVPSAWRGGLLGQASVLTLTANGVDTSPVIRGVWLLENILGAPPNPPPPDVPAIEPDIRGAKTIRDQLNKHQEAANCRTCHLRIDPPGFALESYDAIGRWRGHYVADKVVLKVDASGQFGPHPFEDVREFKKLLFARQEQFAHCLVEKLLLYALGRELEMRDRPDVRRILDTAAADGYRLRDLVLLSVQSQAFRQK